MSVPEKCQRALGRIYLWNYSPTSSACCSAMELNFLSKSASEGRFEANETQSITVCSCEVKHFYSFLPFLLSFIKWFSTHYFISRPPPLAQLKQFCYLEIFSILKPHAIRPCCVCHCGGVGKEMRKIKIKKPLYMNVIYVNWIEKRSPRC